MGGYQSRKRSSAPGSEELLSEGEKHFLEEKRKAEKDLRAWKRKEKEKEEEQAELNKFSLDDVETSEDIARDIRWVYCRIRAKKDKLRDAPSPGAADMLDFVRKSYAHRKWFYTTMLSRAIDRRPVDRERGSGSSADSPGVRDLTMGEVAALLAEVGSGDMSAELNRLRAENSRLSEELVRLKGEMS